jgi:hypothetical protein
MFLDAVGSRNSVAITPNYAPEVLTTAVATGSMVARAKKGQGIPELWRYMHRQIVEGVTSSQVSGSRTANE